MRRPRIGITVGDPAGIGPEIADAAMADPRVRAACDAVRYGPSQTEARAGWTPGVLSAEAGQAAYNAIVAAVADARAGHLDGIATAPISKAAFAKAGLPWPGHTELLAHLCGAARVAMLFHAPALRVVLATVHVALRDVPALVTPSRLRDVVELAVDALPRFGITTARVAVAGLNPHAGEHGLMGHEDQDVIAPVVAGCREQGLDVQGPIPADTVFVRASRGEFDVVVACYHDQGLIPVKLLAFGSAVNVTLGLPIVRTSVDHGTAFDIAGRGLADPGSLIEAVLLAARLAAADGSPRSAP
jgi:4-hydroxythreonine-4-phosphate dehydrogenase